MAEMLVAEIEWQGGIGYLASLRDITEHKKLEQELKRSYKQLRENFEAINMTISKTVELRDPYTAGHQERVARLAKSLAQEMKLPGDLSESIYTSGLIHDIGKISIPSEILSKPGRLNELEYSLIQTHVQAGYDIIKNIDFPYPIARWVLEHHERLNGTGYPDGLTDKQISLEAKILAVADTVVAMASHRPYRPSLGIDKALKEISDNQNVLYDSGVVNACLQLFREKGFKFE